MILKEHLTTESNINISHPDNVNITIELKFKSIEKNWICILDNESMLGISKFLENSNKSQWVKNISSMHKKFGVNDAIDKFDDVKLKSFLDFRIKFIQEELDELKTSTSADDVVDALLDICVVAIGTLDAYNVDADLGWMRIHEKNMAKEVGIKKERPNPLGLPDLIKPDGWTPPTHADNVGLLSKIY